MAVIFYLSSSPDLPAPPPFPYADKLGHALAYGVLGALLWRTFRGATRGKWQVYAAIESLTVGVLYGATMELYQSTLSYRTCEWGDVVANTIGVAVGVVICQRRV